MKKLLITLPDHDIETYYLSFWSRPIIEEANKKGIKVLELKGQKSTKDVFLSFLGSHNPKFVVLNGHGDSRNIYGHNDEVIISEEMKNLFRNKIIYTVACEAAKNLGKSITKNDKNCFIGYTEKFIFLTEGTPPKNPLRDKIAASFFNPTNKIPLSIIKGHDTEHGVEIAKEEFKREIARWRSSGEIEAPWILPALFWDLNSLVHLGEKSEF